MKSVAAALLVLAATSCGGDRAQLDYTRHDSAGVTIAESFAPRWVSGPAWTVGPSPFVDLASAGSGASHEFFRIRNAARLEDGSIAVANSGSGEIRLFGPDGRALAVIGRPGDGPGEFRRLASVHPYRGDSLIAFDDQARRLSVYGPDGTLGRIVTLASLQGPPAQLFLIRNGEFLIRVHLLDVMAMAEGRIRVPAPLLHLSAEGAVHGEIARAAGFETFVFDRGDAAPPFRLDSFIAASDSTLHLGDATRMEFRTYHVDGALEQVTRLPAFDLGVPERVRDSIRATMLAQEMPEPLQATHEAMANSIPRSRPAYSGLLVDEEGFVWAAQYLPTTAFSSLTRDWLVFAPSGEWLGTLSLPPNFELYEAGTDYLLGRSRNRDGVETVQMLSLSRSP